MGERETTAAAPGVTREDSWLGYTLTGTKEALLASGIAQEGHFWNGRLSSNGRRLTTVHFKIDGNHATCKPIRWREGEYLIEVDYPKDEAEGRRNAWVQEKVQRDATDALNHGLAGMLIAFNIENDPEKPWAFPAATIDELKSRLHEVMCLFESGLIVRPGQLPEGNAEFQRFMQRAQGCPPAPPA